MSDCFKHQWFEPKSTTAEVHPPCPYCRIVELETQEVGFVATLSQQENEIAALKEENTQYVDACRQFEQTVEKLEAELTRKPVCVGYVEVEEAEYWRDAEDYAALSGHLVKVADHHHKFTAGVYIDPPEAQDDGK